MLELYVVTVLLFLLSAIIYTESKIKRDEEEDLATEETVNYIFELTSTIGTCLDRPNEENGNELLRCLIEYYNNLDDIYWMMKDQDKKKKNKAISFVRKIMDNGLPDHITKKINFDQLKVKFQWNDKSVQEVYDAIRDNKALWENVEFMYTELTFDDFEFVSQIPPQ